MLKYLCTVVFRTFWHIHVKHFALTVSGEGCYTVGAKGFDISALAASR